MSPPIRDGSGNSIGSIRLGDGSEIAEVRTGAGDVLFSASAIPDSVVDNFEDANGNPARPYESGETISDYYSGATGNWARTQSNVNEGSFALETSGGYPDYVYSTSGLPKYPSEGDTVKFLIRAVEVNGCIPHFISNVGGSPINGYGFGLYADNGEMYIQKITDESYSTLTSDTNISVSVQTWYWGEASLPTQGDNTIEFSLYEVDSNNNRGTLISDITANDNDYATNTGIGAFNQSSSSTGTVLDWIRVA
jgi:hypothetical protein